MGKKRNSGFLDNLFEVATLLPWWAGCILAAIAYLLLHRYAGTPVPHGNTPAQISKQMTGQLFTGIAGILQYVLPIPLLGGAIASAIGQRKRKRLVQQVADDRSGETLRGMSWRDFERLTGEAFRLRGYEVTETGGGGADGGIDLKLRRGDEIFLVQCKHWKAYKVSVGIVRELYGAMAADGATGGFVVTSGVFTDQARAFTRGRNVELIDGPALRRMIDEARASIPVAPSNQHPPTLVGPNCPLCNQAMVKRTARRGARAGSTFWGCSSYPKCKGVRSVEGSA